MSNSRVSFFGGIALLACGLGPSTAMATAVTVPPAIGYGQDDWNISTLNPPSAIPADGDYFSNLKKVLGAPGQGPGGRGFNAGTGWDFSKASAAATNSVLSDITIDEYYPWVVNSPDVDSPDPDGGSYNVNVNDVDVGGAVFSMTYKPKPGDPMNVHFIQVYGESLNGGATTYHVDILKGSNNPFYDQQAGASVETLPDGSQWFSDEPCLCESGPDVDCSIEGTEDFGGTFYAGVFIATDNVVNGVNKVTIYGGELWGYTYSNSDSPVPEPSSAILTGAGMLALLGLGQAGRKLRRRLQR
jgi:hypothetical protein